MTVIIMLAWSPVWQEEHLLRLKSREGFSNVVLVWQIQYADAVTQRSGSEKTTHYRFRIKHWGSI